VSNRLESIAMCSAFDKQLRGPILGTKPLVLKQTLSTYFAGQVTLVPLQGLLILLLLSIGLVDSPVWTLDNWDLCTVSNLDG